MSNELEWRFNGEHWQKHFGYPMGHDIVQCCGNCKQMRKSPRFINRYKGICKLTRKSVSHSDGQECNEFELRG